MAVGKKARAFVEKLWAKIAPKYAGASQKKLESAFKNVVAELPDSKLKRELVAELSTYCAQLTRLKQGYSEEKAATDSSSSVRFPFNTLVPGEPTLDDKLLKEMKEGVKVQTASLLVSKSGHRLSMSNSAYDILTAREQTGDDGAVAQKGGVEPVRSHLVALRLTVGSLSCAGSDVSTVRRVFTSFLRHLQPAVDAVLSFNDDFFAHFTADDADDLSIDGLLQIVRSFLIIVEVKGLDKLSHRIPQYDDLLAATISYYVDLQVASAVRSAMRRRSTAAATEDADASAAAEGAVREAGDALAARVQYLLSGRSSLVALDVLLQLIALQALSSLANIAQPAAAAAAAGTSDRCDLPSVVLSLARLALLPLHRKLLSPPAVLASQTPSSPCESYAKFVAAVKAAKSFFGDDIDDVVTAALKVAAPASFLEWIEERDCTLIDELPVEKRFRGVRITRFLVDEAESSLCEQLLQLTYRDKPLVAELLGEAAVTSSSSDVTPSVAPSDAIVDHDVTAVGSNGDDFLPDDGQLFFVDKGFDEDVRRKFVPPTGFATHKEEEEEEHEAEEERDEEGDRHQQNNGIEEDSEVENVNAEDEKEQDEEENTKCDAVRILSQSGNGRRPSNVAGSLRNEIASLDQEVTVDEGSAREVVMLDVADVTPEVIVATLSQTAQPSESNGVVLRISGNNVEAAAEDADDAGSCRSASEDEAAAEIPPSAKRRREVRTASGVSANAKIRTVAAQAGKGRRRSPTKCDKQSIVDAVVLTSDAVADSGGRDISAVASPMASASNRPAPVSEIVAGQTVAVDANSTDAPRSARKRAGAPSPSGSPAAAAAATPAAVAVVVPAAKVARRTAIARSSPAATAAAADASIAPSDYSKQPAGRKRTGRRDRDVGLAAVEEAAAMSDASEVGNERQLASLDQTSTEHRASTAATAAFLASSVDGDDDTLTAAGLLLSSGRRQRHASSCSESSTCSYSLRSTSRATPLKGRPPTQEQQQPPAAAGDALAAPLKRGDRRRLPSFGSTTSDDEALPKAAATPSSRRRALAAKAKGGSLAVAAGSARSCLLSPLVEADDVSSKCRQKNYEDDDDVRLLAESNQGSDADGDVDNDDAVSVASSASEVFAVLSSASAQSVAAATGRSVAPKRAPVAAAARQRATRVPAKGKLGGKGRSAEPSASDEKREYNSDVAVRPTSPSSEQEDVSSGFPTRYSLRCRSTPSAATAQH